MPSGIVRSPTPLIRRDKATKRIGTEPQYRYAGGTVCVASLFKVRRRTGFPRGSGSKREGHSMLWTIAIILLVLWILGFSLHIAGGLIHILIVVAVIVVIFQLITGRRG